MSRPGNYLARHGSGFKFQMAVPQDLRSIVGRRMWRRYIPNMLEQEARLEALQLALECRREIDRLRAVTLRATRRPPLGAADLATTASQPVPDAPHQRLGISARAEAIVMASRAAPAARRTAWAPPISIMAPGNDNLGDHPAGEQPPDAGQSFHVLEAASDNTRARAQAGALDLLEHGEDSDDREAGSLDRSPTFTSQDVAAEPEATGLLGLVELWREIARPRARRSQLRMVTCANLLRELIGPLPANQVTRQHIMQFRDHLETTDLSRATARLYLQGIHRLFSVALSEGQVGENPAAGVQLRPGTDKFADRDRRRPFQHEEIEVLFAALDGEPEAFRWIVRLLAYHGMRSGEVVQLHVDDVTPLFGVPVLRVHDRHGSIKNRFSQRDVPLHPACEGLLDYARRQGSGRIFPEDLWRADRFQRTAGVFLRQRVEINDPTVTMHSLRHTWRTLAREIGMPAPVSRAIMGHSMGSDVHEGYGSGPSLRLKAEWMAKIDPLASDTQE